MNLLEEKLRVALRREEPPAGFADRVLGKIPPHRTSWRESLAAFFRLPSLRWAMAGVLLGSLLLGGVLENRREELMRAEGEKAKAQVMQALRLAAAKLNETRKRINEAGRKTSEIRPPAPTDSRSSEAAGE